MSEIFDWKKDTKRCLVIILAAFIMAANIKTFVHTGGLYPAGAMGLTLLILHIGETFFSITLPYTIINLIINAIPVYIGFRFIGKKFTNQEFCGNVMSQYKQVGNAVPVRLGEVIGETIIRHLNDNNIAI